MSLAIKVAWDDKHNSFHTVSKADKDPKLPEPIEKVLRLLETDGGLRRTKPVYIVGLCFMIFVALSACAAWLYSADHKTGGAVVVLFCPFISYSFVAWWSLNSNRLGKIHKFLKNREKSISQMLLEVNLSMNALFVRGRLD